METECIGLLPQCPLLNIGFSMTRNLRLLEMVSHRLTVGVAFRGEVSKPSLTLSFACFAWALGEIFTQRPLCDDLVNLWE